MEQQLTVRLTRIGARLTAAGRKICKLHATTRLLLIVTALSAATPRSAPAADSDSNEPRLILTKNAVSVVESANRFALDLYQRLRVADGNMFFSPMSVWTGLLMTYEGSAGSTKAEMARCLHLETSSDHVATSMQSLQTLWRSNDTKQCRLHFANALWAQRGYDFLPRFLAVTQDQYGVGLARVDFMHNAEPVRQEVNRWIERQTADKIQELVPTGTLDSETRLVLTNAIYFNGVWQRPFDEAVMQDFSVSKDRKLRAAMMHIEESVRYAAADGIQMVELPYCGQSLSMVVLLPTQVDGLRTLENMLTTDNFERWSRALSQSQVDVYLPKFKAEFASSLNRALQEMGMSSLFDPGRADLSGMNGRGDLYISDVIHKAVVENSECRTEAAAATAIVVTEISASLTTPPPAPVFRADHPFIFFIRDRTGAILFLGRIIDPTL